METLYSVIIPAYNEEDWLPNTLAVLKETMDSLDEQGEVIVVDNNSTDKTAQIAKEYGARVVFEPINQISRARNAGARAAHGRYLVFLDADTLLQPELLHTALDNLARGDCCGGGTMVAFDKPISPAVGLLVRFWNWYSVNFVMAAGSFIYCLREGFDATGGFSEKVYASEELWFSRQLKSWGKKRGLTFLIITGNPILTSSRKLEWFTLAQLVLMLLIAPIAIRFRSLCWTWYRRPDKK
jgi:glycosyltransferase involved in cell wall biosynthesis